MARLTEKNARPNPMMIKKSYKTGFNVSKVNSVSSAIVLFALTYQYVGIKLAILRTELPT